MRLLVTGSCGFIGSVLVPKILNIGHHVTGLDCQWFGNYLDEHKNLELIKGDIRDDTFPLAGFDVVIHLAAVANDPHGDLDPKLTWEINALATMQLADRAARAGVQQFIYASSGSVYGVSDAPKVTEELPLVPLSEYNKTKMVAERVVLSYAQRMGVVIFRPGTVCGLSPRMRLDVVVNRYTMQALEHGMIKVMGGDQVRPHIHIEDMTDIYVWAALNPHVQGIFNAGFENISVIEIAQMVQEKVDCKIVKVPSDDPRSYRLNSFRLLDCGFKPRYTVADAIDNMAWEYKIGNLKNEPNWYNVETMLRAA